MGFYINSTAKMGIIIQKNGGCGQKHDLFLLFLHGKIKIHFFSDKEIIIITISIWKK
jgi:hypothetical protein